MPSYPIGFSGVKVPGNGTLRRYRERSIMIRLVLSGRRLVTQS